MQYAFLIYTEKDRIPNMTSEQAMAARNANIAIVEEAAARRVFHGIYRLQPPSQSVTARRHQGQLALTDGPFAETKEILGGFYLIDCKDENDARYWAGRLTQTGCSTAVEFRPVAEFFTGVEALPERAEASLAEA